ncbi:glucose / Sorbosone dehydrogenase family protein, partial [Vibrio parahaemolyticus V-223/04]
IVLRTLTPVDKPVYWMSHSPQIPIRKIHSYISPTANEPRKETPSHLPPQR